jgi:hypothetical protein
VSSFFLLCTVLKPSPPALQAVNYNYIEMQLKPRLAYRSTKLIKCRPAILRRDSPCLTHCTAGDQQHPVSSAPDVLILDATNILSRAAIDAKRCSDVPGVSIRYCFEAWVNFLMAATPPHLLVIAVFDNPASVSKII